MFYVVICRLERRRADFETQLWVVWPSFSRVLCGVWNAMLTFQSRYQKLSWSIQSFSTPSRRIYSFISYHKSYISLLIFFCIFVCFAGLPVAAVLLLLIRSIFSKSPFFVFLHCHFLQGWYSIYYCLSPCSLRLFLTLWFFHRIEIANWNILVVTYIQQIDRLIVFKIRYPVFSFFSSECIVYCTSIKWVADLVGQLYRH